MILAAVVEGIIYDAHSLKDKRSVIKSMISRIRRECNVSISETAYQNLWQRTELELAAVSSDAVQAERVIDRALAVMDSFPEFERTITQREWH